MGQEPKWPQGLQVAEDAALGAGAQVKAAGGQVGPGVRLGARSRILCRHLVLEEGVCIGDDVEITATEVHLRRGAVISAGTQITAVETLRMGRFSRFGPHSQVAGRRIQVGDFLWGGGHVLIGGGGAFSPNAVLTMGDRCLLVDYVYVNLADEVAIGHGTALSYHVTVLTHGVWQPVLEGYDATFGPVRIGDDVVVYTGSTVLPGVTIGDGATVGACSLVHRDVPAHVLAAGVPARVIREEYPPRLDPAEREKRVLEVLERYVHTLEYKGCTGVQDRLRAEGTARFEGPWGAYRLVRLPRDARAAREELARWQRESAQAGERLIAVTLVPVPAVGGAIIVDLANMAIGGETDEVSEDLRDHLRRNGIRIFTDRPFRALRPQALRRLLDWAGETE